MSNRKKFNFIGFIAALMAVAGAAINIGHFCDNKLYGWFLIFAGLALAIISMWVNIRKHKR